MKALTTVPNREWKALPSSAKAATRLGYRYYFSGEKCRNGHLAPSKVHNGCIVCMGLAKARADIRMSETIALRELDKLGPVRRPETYPAIERAVLVAIAERGGVFTQAELVDGETKGMGKASISRAIKSLTERKLIVFDSRMYRVTPQGHASALRLGAAPAPFTPLRLSPGKRAP